MKGIMTWSASTLPGWSEDGSSRMFAGVIESGGAGNAWMMGNRSGFRTLLCPWCTIAIASHTLWSGWSGVMCDRRLPRCDLCLIHGLASVTGRLAYTGRLETWRQFTVPLVGTVRGHCLRCISAGDAGEWVSG